MRALSYRTDRQRNEWLLREVEVQPTLNAKERAPEATLKKKSVVFRYYCIAIRKSVVTVSCLLSFSGTQDSRSNSRPMDTRMPPIRCDQSMQYAPSFRK